MHIWIPKAKDTGDLLRNEMTIIYAILKKNASLNVQTLPFPLEKYTAINILAHKYLGQQVLSSGSSSVNACWVRKWGIFQMLMPSINSILLICERRWGQP